VRVSAIPTANDRRDHFRGTMVHSGTHDNRAARFDEEGGTNLFIEFRCDSASQLVKRPILCYTLNNLRRNAAGRHRVIVLFCVYYVCCARFVEFVNAPVECTIEEPGNLTASESNYRRRTHENKRHTQSDAVNTDVCDESLSAFGACGCELCRRTRYATARVNLARI
jgi:hypothetical protein